MVRQEMPPLDWMKKASSGPRIQEETPSMISPGEACSVTKPVPESELRTAANQLAPTADPGGKVMVRLPVPVALTRWPRSAAATV
jgi:hypothetical protein